MIDGDKITYNYYENYDRIISPIPQPEEGGYARNFEFYLTDHLGNVRVVYQKNKDGKAEIVQENSYYPYGMLMRQTSSTQHPSSNNFLYNGKEQQNFTGYYAYGFRQFDSQIARWHLIDKLAESYYSQSPYGFAGNNPISNVEILGLGYTYNWNTGEYQNDDGDVVEWGEVYEWIEDEASGGSESNNSGGVSVSWTGYTGKGINYYSGKSRVFFGWIFNRFLNPFNYIDVSFDFNTTSTGIYIVTSGSDGNPVAIPWTEGDDLSETVQGRRTYEGLFTLSKTKLGGLLMGIYNNSSNSTNIYITDVNYTPGSSKKGSTWNSFNSDGINNVVDDNGNFRFNNFSYTNEQFIAKNAFEGLKVNRPQNTNYFITINAYKFFPSPNKLNPSAAQTIFHEIYCHVFLPTQYPDKAYDTKFQHFMYGHWNFPSYFPTLKTAITNQLNNL